MAFKTEVKASIIRVAGDITVEYIRQCNKTSGNGNDTPLQLDSVIQYFNDTYLHLAAVVPQDYTYEKFG